MASAIQFDPYHKWLGIPPEEQPPNHYRLLGIRLFEADVDVIQSAADQRMGHLRTFQTGTHAEWSQKILNELAAARVCLLRADRKATYDVELKHKLAVHHPAPPPVPRTSAPPPQAVPVAAPVHSVPVARVATQPAPASAPSTDLVQTFDFDADKPGSRRHRSRKSNRSPLVVAACAIAVIALASAGAVYVLRSKNPSIAANGSTTTNDRTPNGTKSTSPLSPPDSADDKTKIPPQPEPPKPDPPRPAVPEPRPLRRMPGSIDDSDTAGFTRSGDDWQLSQNVGVSFKSTHIVHKPGAGEAVATWTFDGLENGTRYRIFASWHHDENHASNARYLITGVVGGGNSVEVDQRAAARGDATFNGHKFQELVSAKCATGTITVRLQNDANNNIVADAVLLVPDLRPETPVVSTARPPVPAKPVTPAIQKMPPDDGKPTVARADDPTWLTQFNRPVTGIAMLADEARAMISTLDADNPASLWDLDEHIERRRIDTNRMPYQSVAVVPSQRLFFLGTESGSLTVWDLREDDKAMVYSLSPNVGPITSLAALADGKTLAIGGRDKVLLVKYDVKVAERWTNYDVLAEWTGFTSPVTALAVSTDGRRIVAGCGGTFQSNLPRSSDDMKLHGYDVPSKDTKDFPGHHGSVWSMALTKDGSRLVTASSDGKVRVWDTAKARMLQEMPGHDGAVLAVAISDDGGTIVSGGEDTTVRVWDARTGRVRNVLRGHHAPVRAIALSMIGKHVLSGAQDGELRLFSTLGKTTDATDPVVAEKRLAPPSESARAAASKLVQEVFAPDFAKAKSPSEKLALADTLLAQAVKSRDNAERYVLVEEARKLALSAGNFGRALSAVRDQAERFDIDEWALNCTVIDEAAKSATTNTLRKQLGETVLDQANRAVAEDKYEEARHMLTTVLPVVKKTNDAALTRQITARGKEVLDLAKAYESVRKASDTLEESPDDPAANLALGRHLCFTRQDWTQGLPHLAKGEDAALGGAAKQDIDAPTAAEDQIAVADSWWELASAAEGIAKTALLSRAEFWYREALPQLSGLAETKANKRLEEIATILEAHDNSEEPGRVDLLATRSLATKLRNAVKANNLVRTAIAGSRDPRNLFTEVPAAGILLIGFNYSVEDDRRVVSVQPLYAAAKGIFSGAVHGDPARGKTGKVEALKGYAVGGMEVYGQGEVSGFVVIFMRITKSGLDTNDTRRSDRIGGDAFGAGSETLGADGQPVVGVFGTARLNNRLEGIGLIQVSR